MAIKPRSGSAGEVLYGRAVLDALPRAIIVTAPDGEILSWNRQAEKLYGWREQDVIGRSVLDVLVPMPHRDSGEEILERVRVGEGWQGDFILRHRNGNPLRVSVIDKAIVDEDGDTIAIVGASEDVTEQRVLEQRAADLTENLSLALEAGGLGTFRWDMATGVTVWDSRLEALFGLAPGSFEGTFDAWIALLHPDDAERVVGIVEEAVRSKAGYTVEHRVLWPDGSVHWLHGAGQVTLDSKGGVTGTIGCTRDITARIVAEEDRQRLTIEAIAAAEKERISRERLEFLGAINDVLSGCNTRAEVMRNVTRAAVPRLGDWCSMHVLPRASSLIPEVEIAHANPEMVRYARELQDRFPYDTDAAVGIPHVIRSGASEFYPLITDAVIGSLATSDAERDIMRELELRSAIAVPLVKRGQVLGAIQFVMTSSGRLYTPDDLALAEALAGRIASSLANIRLSDEQRAIASALQASLLPDKLPALPRVQIAVRYWAVGDGVEVGGDFYDAFQVTGNLWAVVVGDVCGTGPAAAAVTGLARHSIASAAWHGDDPSSVLTNLNRTMRVRESERFCTAVYGTLKPSSTGVTFSFACGGHPLPIVAKKNGSTTVCGIPGSLIGVFDDFSVTATTVSLEPDDVVVLYTDGVTDVSPPNDLSADRFAALVGRMASETMSAEDLADRIHSELRAISPIEQRQDDIALMVLRVTDALQ